jgi:hypothetical protein
VTESNFSIVSIADLGPASEPEWLWKGYIARQSITLLSGFWKAGKSTLFSYLLRDLYRGGGLAEETIVAPTLILSEEPDGIWCQRRDNLKLSERILFARRPTFAKPDTARWRAMIWQARDAIEERGVRLVVLDTLPNLWPVNDENNASEVLAALMPLRDLSNAGAAVLLVGHSRKCDGSQGTATRGSGALPGFVDVIVEFRRHATDDPTDRKRVLTAYGRYEATPAEQVIELQDDGFVVIGDRREVRARDLAASVTAMLPTEGAGVTAEDLRVRWSEGFEKPGLTVLRSVLNQGATDGRWTRSGTGRRGDPWRFRVSDSIPSSQRLGGKSI